MKTKICTNCIYEKLAKDFYKDKRNKDRLTIWCKACINIYQSLYYQENKEILDKKHKEYYYKNREKINKFVGRRDFLLTILK